jgi:tetratricopeptide (TPR) repeat protein
LSTFKQLIHEAHRRSLWQVLGIYLAVSWIALQIVDVLVSNFGLPDWVPPGALVLLVIGLPIVLATAFVQEGMGRGPDQVGPTPPLHGGAALGPADPSSPAPHRDPSGAHPGAHAVPAGASPPGGQGQGPGLVQGTGSLDLPSTRPSRFAHLFTWRNAIAGGVLAFAALGFLVVSYWFMWSTGIGPVGSLVAQGVIEVEEPIVLAEFHNGTNDPVMGELVTSTLRIDLVESPVITLAERAHVADVLRRMERDPDAPLTAELAREVAVREGLKAVIEGDVQPAGVSYVLTATIRATEDGRSLSAFRVTADDPDAVVGAIDELSQRIRERAGESLRTIRAGEPLEGATTSSLEALRKLTEAEKLTTQGDDPGAIALLEEAVELDPTFAMAYRKLAVLLRNNRIDADRMVDAASLAYEHRSRLTDRERYLTEAYYHQVVSGDWDAQLQAYRAVLRAHPDDVTALNNLALMYLGTDREAATELLERAVAAPGAPDVAYQNLTGNYIRQNRLDKAQDIAERFQERYPDNLWTVETLAIVDAFAGRPEEARPRLASLYDDPAASRFQRVRSSQWHGAMSQQRGRAADARPYYEQALREAEELGPSQELRRAVDLARVDLRLSLSRERALAVVNAALDRGLLEAAPVLDRPFFQLATFLAEAGEVQRTQELLGRWSEETPPEVTPDLVEARQSIVHAFLAEKAGDYESALALLDEGRRGLDCTYCWMNQRARIVAGGGDRAGAIAAWEERARSVDTFLPAQLVQLPLAYEQLCALHAEAGNGAEAVNYCGLFVSLWESADPELQPRVDAARRAMENASRITGD